MNKYTYKEKIEDHLMVDRADWVEAVRQRDIKERGYLEWLLATLEERDGGYQVMEFAVTFDESQALLVTAAVKDCPSEDLAVGVIEQSAFEAGFVDFSLGLNTPGDHGYNDIMQIVQASSGKILFLNWYLVPHLN